MNYVEHVIIMKSSPVHIPQTANKSLTFGQFPTFLHACDVLSHLTIDADDCQCNSHHFMEIRGDCAQIFRQLIDQTHVALFTYTCSWNPWMCLLPERVFLLGLLTPAALDIGDIFVILITSIG
jgi:hypothetical protein